MNRMAIKSIGRSTALRKRCGTDVAEQRRYAVSKIVYAAAVNMPCSVTASVPGTALVTITA
jgi:hypothetical protein